jgi:hypothetical protein
MSQRDLMRKIWEAQNHDVDSTVREYARKEGLGQIVRKSNIHSISALSYAQRLFNDGLKKGWLK